MFSLTLNSVPLPQVGVHFLWLRPSGESSPRSAGSLCLPTLLSLSWPEEPLAATLGSAGTPLRHYFKTFCFQRRFELPLETYLNDRPSRVCGTHCLCSAISNCIFGELCSCVEKHKFGRVTRRLRRSGLPSSLCAHELHAQVSTSISQALCT